MRKELMFTLSALALTELSTLAFSKRSRKEIGVRDRWTCQGLDGTCTCGLHGSPASYKDGYMMEAAHDDHDKSNPMYDEPDNGRILCRTHHAMDHYLKGEYWEAEQILSRGIYHWKHAGKIKQQLYLTFEDLQEVYERENTQSLQSG